MDEFFYSRSYKLHNEDSIISQPGLIALMDGATPLDKDSSSNFRTSIFVSTVLKNLSAYFAFNYDTLPVDQCLEHAITDAQKELGSHGITATFSCFAWHDNQGQILTIGDSAVLVERTGEYSPQKATSRAVMRYMDPLFQERGLALNKELQQALAHTNAPHRVYSAFRERLLDDRHSRNTESGAWVISDYTPASELSKHIHRVEIDISHVKNVIVASDGVLDLIDIFNLIEEDHIFEAVSQRQLPTLLSESDILEFNDPQKTNYPRFSDYDDASLVYKRLNDGSTVMTSKE